MMPPWKIPMPAEHPPQAHAADGREQIFEEALEFGGQRRT